MSWASCSLTCFLHFLYSLCDFSFQSLSFICRHRTSHWQHCEETQNVQKNSCFLSVPFVTGPCWEHWHFFSLSLTADAWPVSWATTLVASVTMLSEETVTMLNSLSEVDAPGHTSAPSSEPPPATTRRFMPAFPWWTVLTWERRLSTLLNPRPHLSHRKGFSPAKARDAH